MADDAGAELPEPWPERLADLEQQVVLRLHASPELTRQAAGHVRRIRTALTGPAPDSASATTAWLLCRSLCMRAQTSDRAATAMTLTIWAYSVAWLALVSRGAFWLAAQEMAEFPRSLMVCSLAGAVGGVIQGLYGLRLHIRARDFDPALIHWYLSKPLTGAILGPVAYATLAALTGQVHLGTALPVVSDDPAAAAATTAVSAAQRGATCDAAAITIGFLAGYSERFCLDLADQVLRVVLRRSDSAKPSPDDDEPDTK